MEKNNHQYRAAIYARYSSVGQRDESIEGQIRECQDFAKRNNIAVVKIYADRAVSGTSTAKRDEFNKMIKESEKGIFDAVICWKIDRFARNRYDSAMNKARLKKNGCRLFYAKESIPDGPEGIILESVMEGYAEYYSENLSQNVKRGNYESALECKTLGVKVLGYRKAPDGKYEIDPDNAPAVRYIFEQYASGTPSVDIINELNNRGYKTLTGGKFGKNSVAQIVRNEKYAGVYTYKDCIRIEGGIPALVDRETFDKCQAKLEQHRRSSRNQGGQAVGKYLLTGKLYCGICGQTMVSGTGTSKTGRQYGYYQCTGAMHHKCNKKRIKKEKIEAIVIDKLKEIIHDDKFINTVADKAVEYQNGTMMNYRRSATSELERRRKDAIKARDNIIRAIEGGLISDALQARYKSLDDEIISLETAIADYKHDAPIFTKEQIVYYFKQFRKNAVDNPRYEERLIDTFLNSAFIYADGRLVLCFNYSGENNKLTLTEVDSALDEWSETADCRDFSDAGEGSNSSLRCPPNTRKVSSLRVFFFYLLFMAHLDNSGQSSYNILCNKTYGLSMIFGRLIFMTLTISDVSEFRRAVKEKFRVEIHFHDSCGGQYFSLDVNSPALQQFIEQYFAQKRWQAVFSDDLLSFTVKDRI